PRRGRRGPVTACAPALVGFAVLGSMGAGMARRLLAAGYPLVGWNRTKSRAEPLLAEGLEWAATPRELAERTDVVLSSLFDAEAVRAVLEGPDGLLAAFGDRHVFLEMSTIAADVSVALAGRVRE